jgi:hypothetical protein
LVLLLTSAFAGADTIREALVNLCDPAKIATITAERGANPRVRKICYWLEMARQDGRDPVNEMREGLGGEMPHFGDHEGISARIRIDLLLRLVPCNPA